MSSMASNYDMPRLTLGQIAAVSSVVLAVIAVYMTSKKVTLAAVPFTLITTAYGIMMFASSYVEEEHHFWYYATTAWIAYISNNGFNGYVTYQREDMLPSLLTWKQNIQIQNGPLPSSNLRGRCYKSNQGLEPNRSEIRW